MPGIPSKQFCLNGKSQTFISMEKVTFFFFLFSTFNFIIILKSYSSQKMKQNLFLKILGK